MVHFFGFKKKMWASDANATLILGRRRTGKSTILAMIAQRALKAGYKVYSNYPIYGCYAIPKKTLKNGKIVTDKDFLYDNPLLQDSFVLLDEISEIWNGRSFGKWTEDDSRFFNFLGKNNTRLFMVCQYYDTIDLNVKRALDRTWFVRHSLFPNTSIVECDLHDMCKVEDLNTRVLDTRYHKIQFEACEISDGKYRFRRKKWYPYFFTLWKEGAEETPWDVQNWEDMMLFDESKVNTQEKETPVNDPLKTILRVYVKYMYLNEGYV